MHYQFFTGILMQVLLFCGIPFIFWLVTKRKELPFLRYVGLQQVKRTGTYAKIMVFVCCYLIVYGIVHFVPAIAALTQPSANAYEGAGIAAILPAVLVCFIQQGLSEEVLFRGFIGKRLILKLGFQSGNILQAIVFSAVHVLLSISSEKDIVSYLIIFVSITAGGWLLGYLDEKLYNGSIIPSILLHGLGNYMMILSVAF